MKYLIIKCEELGDQWECDANREPVCITDNFDKYNQYGYEVYEILDDGTFELIKNYEESDEEGFAIYKWYNSNETDDKEPDVIIEKFKNAKRSDFTKSKIKKLKSEYGFKDTIDEIYMDIRCSGEHGEEIGKEWVVLGEYTRGFRYPKGY